MFSSPAYSRPSNYWFVLILYFWQMNEKLKIGFDAKRAFLNPAGLGSYSRTTIRSVARFYPGNDYLLFSPKPNARLFHPPQHTTLIQPRSLWWRALNPLWRSYRMTRLTEKAGLDIFHGLSHELPFGIQQTAIKSVVTIHDLIFMRHPEFYKPADRKIYRSKLEYACREADKVIAISQQTKNDLKDYIGLNPAKIEVIYQAINPLYFEVAQAGELQQTQNSLKLPGRFMLSVGTIEARKNLGSILNAMELTDYGLPLVVVGKPTRYLETLQTQIRKLDKQLIFLHLVTDRELSHLYQLAELMLYPSVFEGFGLPVAEAQASGCPVITSNAGGLSEAGGDAAHYVAAQNPGEIDEGIQQILQNKNYRNELIRKGQQNALRFTSQNYAQQLMQLYKQLAYA
jgi:glycosyltransferase involved in cell wall biosynthesis